MTTDTRAWVLFRISPPLYALNGCALSLPGVPLLGDLALMLTIVDSGAPLGAQMTGGTIAAQNDNYGLFHHSQIRIERTGVANDWLRWADIESVLEIICNKVIDWYRYFAAQSFIRRLPGGSVRGLTAHDSAGGFALLGMPYVEGSASVTAPDGDLKIQKSIQSRLARNEPPSTWTVLHMDAQADLASSSLRTALLLANTGLETLVNTSFRALASKEEVAAMFAAKPAPGFRTLLREVNRRAPTGLSSSRLVSIANRVNVNRDDVIHGNPVELVRTRVEDSVDALGQLIDLLVPAVQAAARR